MGFTSNLTLDETQPSCKHCDAGAHSQGPKERA